MPEIHNKQGDKSNTEVTKLAIADVSVTDYSSSYENEHFGLLLSDSATLHVRTTGGTSGLFTFPPGYNPVALTHIFNDVSNSITSIQVFY